MIEFFILLFTMLAGSPLIGIGWILLKANNMIESQYEGLAVFVMFLFLVINKIFKTEK